MDRLTARRFDNNKPFAKNDINIFNIIERLAELEDKLESGELVELGKLDKFLKEHCGGRPPVKCGQCVKWGSNGWAQYQVGYCEGDNRPHKADDYCSYGERKEAGANVK